MPESATLRTTHRHTCTGRNYRQLSHCWRSRTCMKPRSSASHPFRLHRTVIDRENAAFDDASADPSSRQDTKRFELGRCCRLSSMSVEIFLWLNATVGYVPPLRRLSDGYCCCCCFLLASPAPRPLVKAQTMPTSNYSLRITRYRSLRCDQPC